MRVRPTRIYQDGFLSHFLRRLKRFMRVNSKVFQNDGVHFRPSHSVLSTPRFPEGTEDKRRFERCVQQSSAKLKAVQPSLPNYCVHFLNPGYASANIITMFLLRFLYTSVRCQTENCLPNLGHLVVTSNTSGLPDN